MSEDHEAHKLGEERAAVLATCVLQLYAGGSCVPHADIEEVYRAGEMDIEPPGRSK